MRAKVCAGDMPADEGSFPLDDARGAQEAFLVSTARLAQPIAAIGDAVLPVAPGPQTLRAQALIERAMDEKAIA